MQEDSDEPIRSKLFTDIPFSDLKAATLLVQECCQLGMEPAAWQTHLLEQVAELLDSSMVLFHKTTGLARLGEDGQPAVAAMIQRGFSEQLLRDFAEYSKTLEVMQCPFEAAWRAVTKVSEVVTVRVEDLLDQSTWHNSPLYCKYLKPNGVESLMCTRFTIPDGVAYTLIVHQLVDRPPFSDSQRNLFHFLFSQIASLLGEGLSDPAHPSILQQLSHRDRDILHLFLSKLTEAEVAEQLDISPHTVRDYAKRLNKFFEVHSREQLIFATVHFSAALQVDFEQRQSNDEPPVPGNDRPPSPY